MPMDRFLKPGHKSAGIGMDLFGKSASTKAMPLLDAGGDHLLNKIAGHGGKVLPFVPYVWAAAENIFAAFRGNKDREVLEGVIEDRQMMRKRLYRMSRGEFTDDERTQIMDAYEPTLRRLYGGLAARGGAEADFTQEQIFEEQLKPFLQVQAQAQVLAGEADIQTYNLMTDLIQRRPSAARPVTRVIGKYWTLKAQGLVTGNDPVFDGLASIFGVQVKKKSDGGDGK